MTTVGSSSSFSTCFITADHDLRQVALIERKQLLGALTRWQAAPGTIRYNDHIAGQGGQVFSSACGHGLEGIVAKRADSHYVEGRTTDWVKVKCLKRQEFVIGGWTEPGGGRASLGALLVGYYRSPSELIYCGRVGTGFTQQSLSDLHGPSSRSSRSDRRFATRRPVSPHAG